MDYSDLVKVSCSIRENQYLNSNESINLLFRASWLAVYWFCKASIRSRISKIASILSTILVCSDNGGMGINDCFKMFILSLRDVFINPIGEKKEYLFIAHVKLRSYTASNFSTIRCCVANGGSGNRYLIILTIVNVSTVVPPELLSICFFIMSGSE